LVLNLKRKNVVVLLILLGILLTYLYISNPSKDNSIGDKGEEYLFVRPVFAQTASEPTFLEQEAGMSIYMKANETIDLSRAKTVFKYIEKETSEYIVGSMSLPDLPETDDVHCFVHRDGWIVVYYLKDEPIGKIIDWSYYSNGSLAKTKLQIGLENIAIALGLSVSDAKYYHFQYPYADKWTVVVEVWPGGTGEDNFRIKIPSSLMIFEISWAHNENYGKLAISQLTPDEFHTVTARGWSSSIYGPHSYFEIDGNLIHVSYETSRSNVAIFLVYTEVR